MKKSIFNAELAEAQRCAENISIQKFSAALCAAALSALILAGCTMPPMPAHDTAQQIQSAASLANAIQFQTNALPVEAAPAPNRLPLSTAIERALRQSPELQSALAEVRVAQAGSQQARLLPNPVLDIAFRLPEGGGRTIIETGLSTELTKLLGRPRRISAADAHLRVASANAVVTTLRVMHEMHQKYFAAVALRRESAILAQRTSRLAELLRLAEAKRAAGEGTELDVVAFKADLATANLDLREAARDLMAAQIALAHRLGQPRGRVDWELATPLYTQIAMRGLPDVIAHGLRVRPEIQSGRWQLAALEDQTALARLAWMEDAAAGLSTERDGDWSLGPSVALPLPLFDNGEARRNGARAQAIAARQSLTQTTRQVVREIRENHEAVASLMRTVTNAKAQLVPLHEERVRLARVVYEAGQSDITRLRLAELDLLDAQLKLARLEHRAAKAIIAFDRAIGGSTIEKPNDQ